MFSDELLSCDHFVFFEIEQVSRTIIGDLEVQRIGLLIMSYL